MQQIILLNLLGMCISFLMVCHAERGHGGNIEGLVNDAPLVLVITVLWPIGIFIWCLMNVDKLFKERHFGNKG